MRDPRRTHDFMKIGKRLYSLMALSINRKRQPDRAITPIFDVRPQPESCEAPKRFELLFILQQ